jgi:YfiH family protein
MTVPDTESDFEPTVEAWGRALQSRSLATVARHFFTTRQLRLRGTAIGEAAEWAAVAAAAGVTPDHLALLKQVHGCDVFVIRQGEGWRRSGGADEQPRADILITDDPDVAIVVQVADCVALLLADPVTGLVAAAHAGWRGAACGVPGAAVAALESVFGVRPSNLVAAAGPSIGPCCYEVGGEVRDAFERAGYPEDALARWFAGAVPAAGSRAPRPGHWMLDLWEATRAQLVWAGLSDANIHLARFCTACHPEECWSYRREGAGTGRLAALVRPGRPLRP